MFLTDFKKSKTLLLERYFVFALLAALLCFSAMQIDSQIAKRFADLGRWLCMLIAFFYGNTWFVKCRYRVLSNRILVDNFILFMLFAFALSTFESIALEKSALYLAVCTLQIIIFTFYSRRLHVESWRLIFDVIAFLCVSVSLMGLTGYVTNPDKYVVSGRLAGLANANSMGLIAMIGFIILIAKFQFAGLKRTFGKWRLKWIYLFGAFGCLLVLWLTGSRSSLSGMIAGTLVVMFFAGTMRKMAPIMIVVITLTYGMEVTLPENVQQEINTHIVRDEGGDIFHSRRSQWSWALGYFKSNPWLGRGYAVHHSSGMVIDGSGYHGLLASVGGMGAVAFGLVAFWVLWKLAMRGFLLNKKKDLYPLNRELMALGGGGFIALLVQGVGEPWMLGPGSLMHVVYWLSVGACIAGITRAQVDTFIPQKKKIRSTVHK